MPKPTEICEVTINGKVFRDWESITAVSSAGSTTRYCTLVVTEAVGANGAVGQALQIKPGDKATVTLAGALFVSGQVFERQAAFDANNHSVRVTISSQTQNVVRNSVPLKDGNFKGYSWQAIANKVLKPVGVNLKVPSPPDGFDKPFKNVSVEPGESIWSLLERLGRYRGIRLTDDENGNLVVHGKDDQTPTGGLVEGQNILSANCAITFPEFTGTEVVGQQPGSDAVSGEQARTPAAKVDAKGANVTFKHIAHADIPGDSDDYRRASESQHLIDLARMVTVQATIQGWLTSENKLFAPYDYVSLDSPMLLMKTDKLQVAEVVYSQDQAGTRTQLTLQSHLSSGPEVSGGGSQTPAQEATTPDITPGTATVITDGPKGNEVVQ